MWPCTKCSEPLEDTFDFCWKCGTSREGTGDPNFKAVNRATSSVSPRSHHPDFQTGAGGGHDKREEPAWKIWTLFLMVSTISALLSALYLCLVFDRMIGSSARTPALAPACIFVAAAAWILHIDRNASARGQTLAHLGCLLILIAVALLLGLMAVVGFFF